MGTKGRIRLHTPFWSGQAATLEVEGQAAETFEFPLEGNGYNYQAVAVGHCLRAGLLECNTMPLDESLALMKTMDQVRAQWGLRYPMDGNTGEDF